uniref:Uncharacterized protein n=1 Tax=Amphimedon queenslandica TaxID=400682 RepID=A0A1X7URF8_AMPQE
MGRGQSLSNGGNSFGGGAASTPVINLLMVFHVGSSEGGVCPRGPGQLSQNASNDKDISI